MQLIKISELKSHDKNNYFFDDIQGDNWEEFKKSIQTSGVIEPVIITQDKVIVSGHQRVRACKELNIIEVPCEVKIYENEEKIIKDLLETNLRQRGIGNTNPIKFARCIMELEIIYGIKNGGNRKTDPNNSDLIKNQKDLADDLKISQDQLSNYKKLLTLIPELQSLIEDDHLSPTVGYKVLAKLTKEQQEELVKEFGKEYISSLTQKKAEEVKKYIQEKEQLQQKINEMEVELSQRPEIKKEVIPEDYEEIKKKLDDNKKYYDNLKKDYDKKVEQLNNLEKEIKSLKTVTEEEKYAKKLRDSAIFFCARVNDFIEKTGGFVWLSENINELPEFERKSYIKAIEMVENWATAMKMNMKNYLG